MVELDGSRRTFEIEDGFKITAPGLVATVDVPDARGAALSSRAALRSTQTADIFAEAFEAAGMREIKTITLSGRRPALAAARPGSAPAQEELILEVPDQGDEYGHVVMAIDENGTVTWNFPLPEKAKKKGTKTARAARSAPGEPKRFAIHHTAHPPRSERRSLSFLGGIIGAVIKVIVYPLKPIIDLLDPVIDAVVDPAIAGVAKGFAKKWEDANQPYLVRSFGPSDYQSSDVRGLSRAQWGRLSKTRGRSLLFVHGTFSTAPGGYGNLPQDTMARLHEGYGGRMFAFNHHTLSDDPEENVNQFRRIMPSGLDLDLDIICHSRGGLVARALTGELAGRALPHIRVRRIVFVGATNSGTILADIKNWNALINRYTSLLNLMPPGPGSAAALMLRSIITVVQLIGAAALKGLDGLTAMDPRGGFIKRLNRPPGAGQVQYRAITSNYEPVGGLKDLVLDGLVDGVFGRVDNDLVVPTAGVYRAGRDPSFPIGRKDRFRFLPAQAVSHTDYFGQRQTSQKIMEWLL